MSHEAARECRIFFIRHGETVDNIAQVYGGIRDSPLTNHGVLQVNRLGEYFSHQKVQFSHIYSSDLDRAFRTAEAIRKAQSSSDVLRRLETVKLSLLQEQDFGYFEGRPFYTQRPEPKSSKDLYYAKQNRDTSFQDMETKEAMALRANTFLNEHLLPVLQNEESQQPLVIAIVSHGMLLSTLWWCFLKRLAPRSLTIDSELLATGRPPNLEHLGGWSNTGFLVLEMRRIDEERFKTIIPRVRQAMPADEAPAVEKLREERTLGQDFQSTTGPDSNDASTSGISSHGSALPPDSLNQWVTTVKAINSKVHLKGLKRTGGGVGSSKYDDSQASIDTFFKKKKTS